MKKHRTGRVVALVLILTAGLAVGGYFFASRVLHLNINLPFFSASSEADVVYVQSVAKNLGVGYTGKANRYSGVVEAKEVLEINPDSTLTIEECFVKAGDAIQKGAPLFRYDVDSLTLSYEQMLIDISGLENTIKASNEEIESLEKQIAKTRVNKQYELKLKLQEVQLTLKKSEYELKNKQKQAEALKEAIDESVVSSPVTGRIRSVRSDQSDSTYGGQDSSNAYITIVAGSDYCVKGKVNEQTAHTLSEGMTVTIRSRTNENEYYRGVIYRVNTEEPIKETSYYYYDGGSGEQSSKYAFYVSSDEIEGLMMGQHVYIELGEPSAEDGKLRLPSYYLIQEDDGNAFVFAADTKNRIEKRAVTLGAYDEDSDSFEIVSGLSFTDRIAFPEDFIREGMAVSETNYAGENGIPSEEFTDNSTEIPYDTMEAGEADDAAIGGIE